MFPRVDPVKAIDAQLRVMVTRMVECESPLAMKNLLVERDNLRDRRLALTSRAGSQTREPHIEPR